MPRLKSTTQMFDRDLQFAHKILQFVFELLNSCVALCCLYINKNVASILQFELNTQRYRRKNLLK